MSRWVSAPATDDPGVDAEKIVADILDIVVLPLVMALAVPPPRRG